MPGQQKLQGKKFAILAVDGFEEAELYSPKEALEIAGAEVEITSLKVGTIRSWKDGEWSHSIKVDRLIDHANVEDFDGLMLPGGVINADHLRGEVSAVNFVRSFVNARKPIAAMSHAAWSLIEAGCVRSHQMTSWPSLKTDLENAGAVWVDEKVVVDQNRVTSRKPDDLPFFNEKMIELFSQESDSLGVPRFTKQDAVRSDMFY